jgi:hypothetical protein
MGFGHYVAARDHDSNQRSERRSEHPKKRTAFRGTQTLSGDDALPGIKIDKLRREQIFFSTVMVDLHINRETVQEHFQRAKGAPHAAPQQPPLCALPPCADHIAAIKNCYRFVHPALKAGKKRVGFN